MASAPLAAPGTGPRQAVRSLLSATLRLGPGDRLVVVLAAAHAPSAARLATAARGEGIATRLLGAADWALPRLGVRAAAALDALEGPADGARAVILLGGPLLDPAALALPPAVTALHLPDAPGLPSPLDALTDPADRAAELAALAARLARAGTVALGTAPDSVLRPAPDGGPTARTEETAPAPGRLRIAPLGRVVLDTPAARGTFTATALRVNRLTRLGADLDGRPVRVTLDDGRVTALDCPGDPLLQRFLRRAVTTHRADRAAAVLLRPAPGRTLATLRLTTAPGAAYSTASADLRIDLTAPAELSTAAERNQE